MQSARETVNDAWELVVVGVKKMLANKSTHDLTRFEQQEDVALIVGLLELLRDEMQHAWRPRKKILSQMINMMLLMHY